LLIFLGARNREAAFDLSVFLNILRPSMLSGTGHARLLLVVREPDECQLPRVYCCPRKYTFLDGNGAGMPAWSAAGDEIESV
jgi:hypothetical protein